MLAPHTMNPVNSNILVVRDLRDPAPQIQHGREPSERLTLPFKFNLGLRFLGDRDIVVLVEIPCTNSRREDEKEQKGVFELGG